jgi:FkbM family methyltransferase
MGAYARSISEASHRYCLTPSEQFLLLAHSPLVRLHWLTNHGSPSVRRTAELISRFFCYRIRHRVRTGEPPSVVSISLEPSDFMSYREIFLSAEYALPFDMSTIRTMVDLGGNIGMASLYFCATCPNLRRILIVEANPRLIPKIETNLEEQRRRKDIVVEQVCISNEAAPTTTFYVSNRHRLSLKDRSLYSDESLEAITVPNVRLSDLLAGNGIDEADLLKMDIEGSEFDVLDDTDVLKRFRYLVAEVHGDAVRRHQFCERLNAMGFVMPKACEHDPTAAYEVVFASRMSG